MLRNSILFIFLCFCQLANAQRGVDFRQWSEPFQFTNAEIDANLVLMRQHNINEVWIDELLDRARWEKEGKRLGVKIHSGNQRFGIAWLQQCKPLPNEGGNDSTACISALVNFDGVVSPNLLQLKKNLEPIKFSWKGKKLNIHAISNRYQLHKLTYKWYLKADGKLVESGTFNLQDEDSSSASVSLKMKTVAHDKQNHYLEIFALTKAEMAPLRAGHIVAKEQFQLSHIKLKPIGIDVHSKMETVDGKNEIELNGTNFSYTIDRGTGYLNSMFYNNVELLSGPIVPAFHFPEEEQARFQGSDYWEEQLTVSNINVEVINEYSTTVKVTLNLGHLQGKMNLTYQIYATGDVYYTQQITAADSRWNLDRFGVSVPIMSALDSVEWFGRGPQGSYTNANSSAFIGLYNMPLAGLNHPYAQNNYAQRSETEWVSLGLKEAALFVGSDSTFTCFYPLKITEPVLFYMDELAAEKRSNKRPQKWSYAFSIRLRPFNAQKEKPLKLSRYTASKMAVPRMKVLESKSNEAVK